MSYHVSEPTDEALAPFRTLKSRPSEGLRRSEYFVAENPKVVEKLLRSDCDIESMYLTQYYLGHFEALIASHSSHIAVHVAEKSAMESVVGYVLHQGVMLLGRVPSPPAIESILARGQLTLLVLEGTTDAENMGSIIRNAAALGADALITDETCCDPWLRRSVRVSMGTCIDIPIFREGKIAEVLSELSSSGVSIIAASVGGTSLDQFEFPRRSAIVMGSEGSGLSESAMQHADYRIGIPIANSVDSLNVSAASAIFLYQASIR